MREASRTCPSRRKRFAVTDAASVKNPSGTDHSSVARESNRLDPESSDLESDDDRGGMGPMSNLARVLTDLPNARDRLVITQMGGALNYRDPERAEHNVRMDVVVARTHAELVPDDCGLTSRPEPEWPVEVALAAISGRWKTLVLRELMAGPRSFGDLREALPELSAKVLTERLTELLDQGLVMRDTLPGFPVRTSYQLTASIRCDTAQPAVVPMFRNQANPIGPTNPAPRIAAWG